MKRKDNIQRMLAGLAFMVGGFVLVMGTVILINQLSQDLGQSEAEAVSQIEFERKEPPKQQEAPKPKPKPKPKRQPRNPPAPLTGLDTALSGLDLGLPGFSTDDLNGLNGDLLDGENGVVMTDDTVDTPPKATFQSPMPYPARAKAKGVEGYVVLSLLIGVTGEVEQVKVVESFPEGVFDQVALQGVNAWQFAPAQYQGKTVRAWARQRIRFDLS